MKNLKKVIALIAVLALTLSTVALGATYTDVAEDSAYSVAVESLSKLGIVTGYEDGTYGPEKAVTRAEMAALIARIQGYEETAKAQTATVFTDVPADFWGSGYVAAASNMGIVNGYGDGTFGPDDAVKYEQAVTMIMRTLGYEPFAAANGGYPTGYLAAAQRYGLTKNVSNAVSGTDANRGTIAQLLYNGIDTPLMAQSKWGTAGDIEYTIYDGQSGKAYKTLMSENLGVVKVKGLVVENATTNLYEAKGAIDITKDPAVAVKVEDVYDTTNKDFDNVEGTIKAYLTGESDIAEYLGYRVIFYVMEDEATEDYVVISCAKDSATNSTVEFTLDQYAGLEDGNIEYFKNATDKKATELKLEDEVEVIYNFEGGYDVADIFDDIVVADSSFGGLVTLIDNDNTNGYDVAIVEIGVSAVVDEVTKSKVVLKEAVALAGSGAGSISSIAIDEDAEDEIILYVKDGAVISPADLVEWDVITIVANNKDSKVKYMEVVGSKVSGSVASRKSSATSDAGYAYKIDGAFYDVAAAAFDADKIEVGGAGVFYIDNYGKIVAFVEDETVVGGSAKNYAFVMEAGEKTEFNKTIAQIRLLTANGIDIYTVAKEFELDGEEGDVADIDELLDTVIQYKVNSAGEIKSIVTEDDEFELLAADGSAAFEAEDFDLAGDIDADAKVFILGGESGDWSTTSSFVGTLADLEDKNVYTFDKYITGKGEDCDIVVIKAGYETAGATASLAVLTEVSEGVNDAEEEVLLLSFYKDGELFENVETTEEAAETTGLTAGDIVKVKVSSANVVTSIVKVVNFSEAIRSKETGLMSATELNGGYEAGADEEFTFSYVADYNKTSKKYTIGTEAFKLGNAENVYVIDASAKNVDIYAGAAADCEYDKDITKDFDKYCDYVLVREFDGDIIDVVIIKNVLEIDYTVFN